MVSEDVADDEVDESTLMIDESDVKLEHSRPSENSADELPASSADQSASAPEQSASPVEQSSSSVVDDTKKRHVMIVVKRHLSPAQVTTGKTTHYTHIALLYKTSLSQYTVSEAQWRSG